MAHGAWALLPLLAIASASPQSNYDLQVEQILNNIQILLEESFKSLLARNEKRERKVKDQRLILELSQALSTEYQGGPQTFPEFATLNGTVIELGE